MYLLILLYVNKNILLLNNSIKGINNETIKYKNLKLNVWDIGGNDKGRCLGHQCKFILRKNIIYVKLINNFNGKIYIYI